MPEFDEFANDYARLLSDPVRDRFAPGSKFFFTRKWELLLDYCSAMGVNPSGAAWLDVGCGRGELLGLGAGTFGRVSGCDISGGMLKHCAPGVETVVQTDPGVLPFGNGEFDLVTAVCVYHHVPPAGRKALTAELVRVLRPGGNFVCKIFQGEDFKAFTEAVKAGFTELKIFKPQSCRKASKEIYLIGKGRNQEESHVRAQ